MTTSVKGWLEINAANSGVLDRKIDDLPDFMFVRAALDGGNERNVQADFGESIKSPQFFLQDVRLTTQNTVGF